MTTKPDPLSVEAFDSLAWSIGRQSLTLLSLPRALGRENEKGEGA